MGFIQNHLFCGSVTCLNTLVWNNQAGRYRLYMMNCEDNICITSSSLVACVSHGFSEPKRFTFLRNIEKQRFTQPNCECFSHFPDHRQGKATQWESRRIFGKFCQGAGFTFSDFYLDHGISVRERSSFADTWFMTWTIICWLWPRAVLLPPYQTNSRSEKFCSSIWWLCSG